MAKRNKPGVPGKPMYTTGDAGKTGAANENPDASTADANRNEGGEVKTDTLTARVPTSAEKYAIYVDGVEEDFQTPEFQQKVQDIAKHLERITGERPAFGEKGNILISNLDGEQYDEMSKYDGVKKVMTHAQYLGHDYFPDAGDQDPEDGQPLSDKQAEMRAADDGMKAKYGKKGRPAGPGDAPQDVSEETLYGDVDDEEGTTVDNQRRGRREGEPNVKPLEGADDEAASNKAPDASDPDAQAALDRRAVDSATTDGGQVGEEGAAKDAADGSMDADADSSVDSAAANADTANKANSPAGDSGRAAGDSNTGRTVTDADSDLARGTDDVTRAVPMPARDGADRAIPMPSKSDTRTGVAPDADRQAGRSLFPSNPDSDAAGPVKPGTSGKPSGSGSSGGTSGTR